jgi:hypothetical protein
MAMIKMAKKIGGTGAGYVDKPGKFHWQVMKIDESPTSKKGLALDAFSVTLSVMWGPELGKLFELMLFNPNPTDKESSQEFAKAKQSAFVIATGLATESDLSGEEEREIEIDLQKALHRQVMMELEFDDYNKSETDKKFLKLAYANIYHVDDPRVEKWEKNVEAIKLLPAVMRRDPKGFDLERLGGKAAEKSEQPPKATKPALSLDAI